jgi:hypothetical protein
MPIYGFLIKNKKLLISVISIQLFLILAFRDESLGVDVANYKEYYEFWSTLSFSEIIKGFRFFSNSNIIYGLESGYVLLNWVIAKLGFTFHSYLVIHAAICIFSFACFINRYSNVPWLSYAILICLGIYSYTFCILRQSLAVAFLLFSIKYISKKKFIKFLLLNILAILFHRVAIIFLPLYFISKIKISDKSIISSLIICVAFFALIPVIDKIILQPIFLSTGKTYQLESFSFNKLLIFVFIIFFALIFLMKTSKKGKISVNSLQRKSYKNVFEIYLKNKNICTFFWMFILGIYVQCLSIYMPIFSRIAIGLFFISLIIIIPKTVSATFKDSEVKYVNFTVYLCFLLYFILLNVLSVDSLMITPYVSVWG